MPLIKKTTKEKVNNHKQSDVIEKGARAFAKSLLEATKTAEKIEKQSHKKTDTKSKLSESKTIKISEKLISKEMESLIKKSGHSAEISELLNIVTPQVLETINAIASNSKSNSALTKSVQIPVFKNIAKEEKFLVGSPKDNLEKTTDAVKKGLISATVKAEIKEHPHQDIFAKTINSFIKLFVPQVEKAAHNATGLKIAANVIETAVPGVKGNVVAKIAAVVIEDFANEIPTSAEPQVKLLSSDLKQEIEAHPYRDAVKEFFKIFLPKMLKTFETVGVALAPMLETMAKEAIKKSVPGETGEILATITGQAIQTTKKMAEDSLKKDANLAKLPKADDKAAAKLVTHDDEMPQSSTPAEVAADHTDMPSFEVPQVAMTGSTPDVHADVL